MDDELQRLIADAYSAVLDPAELLRWTEQAGRWIGGRSATVSVVDCDASAIVGHHIAHPDLEQLEDYIREGMHLIDPQLPVVSRFRDAQFYRSAEVVDYADPEVRRYMAFMNDRAGIDQFATASLILNEPGQGAGRHAATLSVFNPTAGGAIDDGQCRRLLALVPTFGRIMALGVLHGRKLDAAWWDGQMAAATEPAMLLDQDGRVLRATSDMVDRLRAGDGLREDAGRLVACDPASHAALGAAMMRAIASRGAATTADGAIISAGAVRIARPSGRPSLIVKLWPLMPVVRHLVQDRAAVLVTLVDPATAPRSRKEVWRQAFGLTRREAEVAALLVEGHSPESAAAMLEMALGTIRIHLRRLFAKSGTSRQADLLRLLLRTG